MNKRFLLLTKGSFGTYKDWPVAIKLLLLVVIPLSIVLIALLSLTVSGLNELEADTSSETLKETVQIISQRFNEQQSILRTDVTLLTNDPILLEALENKDVASLQKSLLATSTRLGFNNLQIVDTEGNVLSAVQTLDLTEASADFEELTNLGLLEIETTRLISTSHGWLLTNVRPIKSQFGMQGVLIAGRLFDAPALALLNFNRTNPQLVTFDAEGNINAVSSSEPPDKLFTVDHNLWSQALAGQTVFSKAMVQGEDQNVAYAPLAIGDRVVAAFGLILSTAATISLRNQLIVTDLLVGGILTLLSILITLILVRRSIVQPIAALASSARQVADGNLEVVAPGASNRDEVGVLASSFNSMTSQLHDLIGTLEQRVADRTKALETSTEISRSLSSLLDQRLLVKEVVEQIQSAFNYYHTHIYLVDEATGDLIMAHGTGEVGVALLARGHRIPRGRGLVGRAAETNAPVLVPDTSKDTNWLPNSLLPDTKSEVAVPISLGEQVLGVIDVQESTIDGLSQEDASLLHAIGHQVAIALRNAHVYEESSTLAELETLINTIGQKIQRSGTVEDVLQTAVREIGMALGASRVSASLHPSHAESESISTRGSNGADRKR